jgi:hypothetical protein
MGNWRSTRHAMMEAMEGAMNTALAQLWGTPAGMWKAKLNVNMMGTSLFKIS